MKFFRQMKIRHKLFLVTGTLVVGFAGVGATYLSMQRVQGEVAGRTADLKEFVTVADLTSSKTLESQSILKSFFLHKNPQLLGQFSGTLNIANSSTTTLEKLAQNDRQREVIAQLKDAIDAYQRAAMAATQAIVNFGLDEHSGMYGEVEKIALTMEAILKDALSQDETKPADLYLLNSLLLTMRRHEKGFLTGMQDVDVETLEQTKKQLVATAAASAARSAEMTRLAALAEAYYTQFLRLLAALQLREQTFVHMNQQQSYIVPLVESLKELAEKALRENNRHGQAQIQQINLVFATVLGGVAGVVVVAIVLLALSLTRSLRRLQTTVQRVTAGDLEARTSMGQGDELAHLGQAFDTLLDERVAFLAASERERTARLREAEQENEALNNSVVSLLHAVSQLSQRDLTVKMPVAEDVTGPVADALNQLAEETAQVLAEVTRIADSVAASSRSVKLQADAVLRLAGSEREEVTQAAEQLATATAAMHDIAARAQTCNTAAEHAITRTQTALETVTNTVDGINMIRDTIRETEKRLKRLGERSQEISGAVNLINGIADRTHILALNASMHAASAGEAGRGFAVVAEEVQRLAENARQATEQIARLVNNIQTETMDTVTTMNTVISQVVEGSRLAVQAGEQMRQTQQSTAELVAAVRQIAVESQEQAKVSNLLRDRAGVIVESTLKTGEQLVAQGAQTSRLLDYASRLVRTVRVFKLPNQPAELHTTDLDPGFAAATGNEADAELEEVFQA
jgi:methyl-accepting chemotaxis protein